MYPSRYEGFGLPLVEAMASGTPVLASRAASIPEVVGESGILLDPDDPGRWADAIVDVMTDAVLRARLRTAGLARAAMFSWERTARITLDVYRRVAAPMTPDPLVSIVIVTWNGRQYLEACLSAVAAQEGVNAETILVDNASTDGTVALRARAIPGRACGRDVRESRVLPGGNNAGVREARGRFVALLNNDTVPEPGWLQALLRGLDEDAGFALVTSRIVYMHDPELIDSAGDGMLASGGAFKRHHGASVEMARESSEVFGVCGAACLMPRRVFEELGGFDEDFFVSHEDVDLSYRARLLGYRCRYVADAVVRHHGSATIGRVSALAIFHGQRNLEWLYVKNTPGSLLLTTLPSHLMYMAAACVHFARAGALGPFLRAKLAAMADCPVCCENGGRFSGRAAWTPPRCGHCSRRDGSRPSCARSASTPGWPEAADDAGGVSESWSITTREKSWRSRCESIQADCAGIRWEAIVVDNASTDGSHEVADAFPHTTLVRNASNVGFGRAVNQAVSMSKAPLLLLMNPDCRLMPGALAALRSALDA